MKDYVPREGSTAGKALAYLRAHGETAAGPLAEACDANAGNIGSLLEYALRNGVIALEKRDGLRYFTVGNGEPIERDKDTEILDTRRPDQRKLAPGIDIDKVLHQPRKESSDSIVFKAPGPTKPEAVPAPLRIALWSDGRLEIWRRHVDEPVVFKADETRELCRYLDRIVEVAA